ncbi:uncharacterized protein LOC108674074 [Hyalella azteca]|uniref:Uncharacterized protein LOC108674074 n=1 Tax=Hyalella azteca TaxID=294128 RepID=A0A8B7NX49_HYAAZ|nr:uncharacterized protein LOC108674074 [Hyalella azteca]
MIQLYLSQKFSLIRGFAKLAEVCIDGMANLQLPRSSYKTLDKLANYFVADCCAIEYLSLHSRCEFCDQFLLALQLRYLPAINLIAGIDAPPICRFGNGDDDLVHEEVYCWSFDDNKPGAGDSDYFNRLVSCVLLQAISAGIVQSKALMAAESQHEVDDALEVIAGTILTLDECEQQSKLGSETDHMRSVIFFTKYRLMSLRARYMVASSAASTSKCPITDLHKSSGILLSLATSLEKRVPGVACPHRKKYQNLLRLAATLNKARNKILQHATEEVCDPSVDYCTELLPDQPPEQPTDSAETHKLLGALAGLTHVYLVLYKSGITSAAELDKKAKQRLRDALEKVFAGVGSADARSQCLGLFYETWHGYNARLISRDAADVTVAQRVESFRLCMGVLLVLAVHQLAGHTEESSDVDCEKKKKREESSDVDCEKKKKSEKSPDVDCEKKKKREQSSDVDCEKKKKREESSDVERKKNNNKDIAVHKNTKSNPTTSFKNKLIRGEKIDCSETRKHSQNVLPHESFEKSSDKKALEEQSKNTPLSWFFQVMTEKLLGLFPFDIPLSSFIAHSMLPALGNLECDLESEEPTNFDSHLDDCLTVEGLSVARLVLNSFLNENLPDKEFRLETFIAWTEMAAWQNVMLHSVDGLESIAISATTGFSNVDIKSLRTEEDLEILARLYAGPLIDFDHPMEATLKDYLETLTDVHENLLHLLTREDGGGRSADRVKNKPRQTKGKIQPRKESLLDVPTLQTLCLLLRDEQQKEEPPSVASVRALLHQAHTLIDKEPFTFKILD